ncbi:MAG: polysulfide reductase NrfD [Gemmatimonadetes bacterium]|nr:polysulfide reductase NrfD [Gemmatimonadota bacterium]
MAVDTGGVYDELPVRRFEGRPRGGLLLGVALVVVGAIAIVAALASDPARAWRAYLANWLFFTSISAGAVMWSAIVMMARGLWSQPVRRIQLSFVAFLPIAWLLFLPLLFVSGKYIFPWSAGFVGEVEHIPAGKALWLNVPFAITRNLVLFTVFVAVALAFAYWSLRPDLGAAKSDTSGAVRRLYDRLTGGWRGTEVEEVRASHNSATLAPILAILYALSLTIIAFDYVMSLEPEWKSTLIGGYFFADALLAGLSVTAVATLAFRRALGLQDLVLPENLHDLGKLHFGFNVVWAYLFWAQFIVIWYGILPPEQSFVIRRFSGPYSPIAVTVLLCLFVIPFFGLLGVKPKKTPATLALFAAVTLVGFWLERWLLVYPSWYHGELATPLRIGWQEIGTFLGFAGLLVLSLLYFASRFPMIQLWRPMAELELLGDVVENPTAGAGVDEA